MDFTRGLLAGIGGAAEAAANAAGDDRKARVAAMRENNLARLQMMNNQTNADWQHGYRMDEIREQGLLSRNAEADRRTWEDGRPSDLAQKIKAMKDAGFTPEEIKRAAGALPKAAAGALPKADADTTIKATEARIKGLSAIIKAGDGATPGSPEAIRADDAGRELATLAGIGAGPRMSEADARAQAEEEAEELNPIGPDFMRPDAMKKAYDGKTESQWIHDRIHEKMYGGSAKSGATTAAPAPASSPAKLVKTSQGMLAIGARSDDGKWEVTENGIVPVGQVAASASGSQTSPPAPPAATPPPTRKSPYGGGDTMFAANKKAIGGLLSSAYGAISSAVDGVSGKIDHKDAAMIGNQILRWQTKKAYSRTDKALAAEYLRSGAAKYLSNGQIKILQSITHR